MSAWSPSMTTGGPSFGNQTIRMVVYSSIAGSGARITLCNRYSPTALGPTSLSSGGVNWRVYADPAGKPFCLCWD